MNSDEEISNLYTLFRQLSGPHKTEILERAKALIIEQRREDHDDKGEDPSSCPALNPP